MPLIAELFYALYLYQRALWLSLESKEGATRRGQTVVSYENDHY